jgi:succinyl-CoA synthetase beta subunit
VPRGIVASTELEARAAAETIGCDVVVKAQALSGGRGKAGGVKFASSPAAAGQAAREIFSMRINGMTVRRVLVVEALRVTHEYYVACAIDRASRCVRCIMSASGGVDIEIVAKTTPEAIVSVALPPYSRDGTVDIPIDIFGTGDNATRAYGEISRMVRLFFETDCSLVEVNPFILTNNNTFVAADAKIVLDDNALYRHPDLACLKNPEEYGNDELSAARAGLSFVGLDGSIGCMVNGAGLAMATMDLIRIFGARPANFLDVGGSSNPQKVLEALRILTSNKNIKVILVNIFGGITRCDDIARGIVLARGELGIAVPMVVRLTGTNEEQGRALLSNAGMAALSDMVAAVQRAVDLDGAAV